MLYTAFIAICLAVGPCDRHHAVDWIAAPEPQQGLGMCMKHGLAYAAESNLARPGEIVKVYCRPVERPANQG